MKGERRVLLNTLALAGGEGTGQVVNLLFVVAFARHYGAEPLGDYSYAMAVGAVAGLFISLGLNGYLLREVARRSEDVPRALGVIVPLQLGLLVLVAVLAGGFAVLTSGPAAATAVALTVLTQLTYRFGAIFFIPFRASEEMLAPMVTEVLYRLLSLGAALLLMMAGAAAWQTLLATTASALLYVAAGWVLCGRRFGRARNRLVPAEMREMLARARGFFGLLLVGTVSSRAAPILLGLLAAREAVGTYAVADRMMAAATLLPLMLANAAAPALSREAARSPAELLVLNGRLLRLTLLAGVAVTAAVIWAAPLALRLLFGEGFVSGAAPLRILVLAVPLVGAEQLLAAQVAAMGLVRRLVRVRVVVLVSYLVLGAAGALIAGSTGLAVAVVLNALLQLVAVGTVLRREGALPLRELLRRPRSARAPGRAG